MNSAFYAANYSTMVVVNSTVTFFDGTLGPAGTYQFLGNATFYPIPASGLIIYAKGADLWVQGKVDGLVTVVADTTTVIPQNATANGCLQPDGRIIVGADLTYAGGATAASPGHAFAALAKNCIIFDYQVVSNHAAVGVYFIENLTWAKNVCVAFPPGFINTILAYQWFKSGPTTGPCTGHPSTPPSPPRNFSLFGTSNIAPFYYLIFNGVRSLNYDSFLRAYQPPGLPEQAYLVDFRLH